MRESPWIPNFFIVRRHNILCAAGILLAAVTLGSAADTAAERAAANFEKQRQSILRQTRRSQTAGSFFLSPWLTATPPAVKADCGPVPEDRLTQLITTAAQETNLRPQLIRAVIRRESAARPCAVSDKGAQGLMQLTPATQQTLGVTDPFDPSANISGGARYLADLLKRYKGDLRRTLAAYNAGPQRVDPDGELPDIPETRTYVAAIMAEIDTPQTPAP